MPTRRIWKDADPARGGDGYSVDIGIDADDHLLYYYDTGDSAARTVVNEEEAQTITGDKTFSGATTFTGAVVINDVTFEIGDDDKLTLGNDNDQVLVSRSTILATNTALTGVMIGTPVTPAVAANSLIISNVTASGDILLAANLGGNSQAWLWVDSSASTMDLYAAGVSKLQLSANGVTPGSDDGSPLGTSSLQFSDLFLASGAVINFNADVTCPGCGATHLIIRGLGNVGIGV